MSDSKSVVNKGAIFVNDRKGNVKAPVKTGKFVDENGVEKKIAIWENTSKNGLVYESFIISNSTDYVKELSKHVQPDNGINEMPF